MPQSRHRHKRHHHHSGNAHSAPHKKPAKRSAVTIMVIFAALMGVFVALIAAGTNWIWLLAGALIGAFTGYLIGRNMDRLAAKNA